VHSRPAKQWAACVALFLVVLAAVTNYATTMAFSSLPDNQRQEAFDAMAYNIVLETLNTVTLGISGEVIQENGLSLANGQLYWRGVAVDTLTEAEEKGVSVGKLLGRLAGVLVWASIIGFFAWRDYNKKRSPNKRRR
jgi:hypothetical protein